MNSEQLIEYFTQVIESIMNRIGGASNLTEDKNAQKLITAILKELDALGIKSNQVMPVELEKVYYNALEIASKELTDMGVTPPAVKKKIHMAAVKEIISKTMSDLKKSVTRAKKSAKTMVNRVVSRTKAEITKGLILGNHSKIVKKRLAKTFQEEGITGFVTSDNKNIRIEKYAETVVRTKMRDANTQGAVNRYIESGVTLVQISKHSPTCHVCARLQGKVVCVSGNVEGFKSVSDTGVKLPPLHPNCRCVARAWVMDYKTPVEIQAAKDEWKSFNPEKDVRSVAQQKAYKKEQDIKRKANDARKQYERMAAVLGKDKMPKTLGGFIRGKQSKSKTYLKLQQQYRQANRELKAE